MKSVVAIVAFLAIAHIAQAQMATARADIIALSSAETGLTASADNYVLFTDLGAGQTSVKVYINGIVTNPNGEHGIHIHTWGDLSNPTGASLGPHYDPHNVPHGCGAARSVGDLGNWTAVSGTIDETREFDLLDFEGDYSIIGRGVVLHANPDDCAVVASSGPRLAAGVIGVVKIAGNPAKAAPLSGSLTASCVLFPTTTGASAGQSGMVSFQQADTGDVHVVGNFSRLGEYGVHVHYYGDLSDRATATNTGGHFDPLNTATHAWPGTTAPHHAGDMGNTSVIYQYDGFQYFEGFFPTMTMHQTANNESIIGRGFIAHADRDDGTGPAGNAGVRHAQCVVGLADPALTKALLALPTIPGVPTGAPPTATPTGNPPTMATPSGHANTILPSLAVLVFTALLAFAF